MTHLGIAISRLLFENKQLSTNVAKKAGIDPSYLSRLQKGQVGVSPETLLRIAKALGKTSIERAEIIAAHMKDESCGLCPGQIQIILNGTAHESDLHPDIEYLQKYLSDPRIRNAVKSLVDLHRENGKPSGKPKN